MFSLEFVLNTLVAIVSACVVYIFVLISSLRAETIKQVDDLRSELKEVSKTSTTKEYFNGILDGKVAELTTIVTANDKITRSSLEGIYREIKRVQESLDKRGS